VPKVKRKADKKLALTNGVTIDYPVQDLESRLPKAIIFDAIAIFSHTIFPEVKRKDFSSKITVHYLKKGWLFLF